MLDTMRKLRNYDFPTLAIAVIAAVCIGFGVYYLIEAIRWVPYPNQIDFGEGFTMYVSELWATGNWNWDVGTEPYITAMYGVIMPIILAPFIWLFGWSLSLGRAAMVIATLVTCFLLYLIASRLTGKKVYGVIAGLLPLTQPALRDWSLMARPDMLAVMFSVAGVYMVVRFKESKWAYASMPLFALALLTKLSALAGIGAILLYLLINKRKVFIRYAASFTGLMALVFGVGNLLTNGEFFRHIVTYNGTVPFFWIPAVYIANLQTVLLPMAILLVISTVYVMQKLVREKKFELIACYFVGTFIISSITALREGSFINYYMEFIFAASLCTALALPKLKEWELARQAKKATATVGVNGILIAAIIVPLLVVGGLHAFPFPDEKYDRETAVVTAMIADTNEPVPTENAGLVLNAGKDPYIEPFIFTNMTELGYWDESQYLEDLRNQRFDYIVARMPITNPPRDGHGHFTKPVIEAINENYSIIYQPEMNFYWYGLCVYESNKR